MFNKKKKQKEKLAQFQKELAELCLKHGINIRAKITAYGPVLEYFEIKTKENKKHGI